MGRKSFLVLLLIVLLGVPYGFFMASGPAYRTLVVFAASSLEGSFKDIAVVFEDEYPDARISFTFASSSTLRTQIELGAMADVFASADSLQINRLRDSDLLLGDSRVFATNSLVVISQSDNEKVVEVVDLGMPGVRLAIAHPNVPAGAYALKVLDKMEVELGERFHRDVLENVATWEINVRHVLTKVTLGEVDAGIVYLSDTLGDDVGKVRSIPIISSRNIVALYPISVIGNASDPKLAWQFVDLLLSQKGQEILAEHGFGEASLAY